ncbi:hypothetical protein MKEN_00623000 [Mycena kentingensis (nom. inval.)]|nr:hypothetical protein MKEN_00623000 [Mycena kentingensis (nom. inval.)]
MALLNLLSIEYTDYELPWKWRIASLGFNSAMFGGAAFTTGALAGAILRTAEAFVKARRNQLPPGLSATQLIRLGALSNGATFGIPMALAPCATLFLREVRFSAEETIHIGNQEFPNAFGDASLYIMSLALLVGLPATIRVDRRCAARGLNVGGVTSLAAVGVTVGGYLGFATWASRYSRVSDSD